MKPNPELPDSFKQIRKAWLVQIKQTWAIISRGGRTVAAFPTREDALVWWSLVTAEEPGKTRPILMDKNTLSANQENRIAQASTTTKPTPHPNIKRQLPRAAATAPNSSDTSKPKPRTTPKRKKKKKVKIKWPSSKTSLRDRMLSTTKHSNIRRPWQG